MKNDYYLEKLNDEKIRELLFEAEQRRLVPKRRNVFKLAVQKLILLARGLDLPRVLKHLKRR